MKEMEIATKKQQQQQKNNKKKNKQQNNNINNIKHNTYHMIAILNEIS